MSVLAEVEVAKLGGVDDTKAEAMIREFFGRNYIVSAAIDRLVAEKAREIVRRYRVRGADAVHLATAVVHGVAVFETFDDPLIKKFAAPGGISGLTVRIPTYEGPRTLPGL